MVRPQLVAFANSAGSDVLLGSGIASRNGSSVFDEVL